MYTYTIEDKVITFSDLSGKIVLIQKSYPNGDAFDTDQEADDWAQSYMAAISRTSAFGPKMGKEIDPIALPTLEELEDRKAQLYPSA